MKISSSLFLSCLSALLHADFQPVADATHVFSGTLVSVRSGPVGMSEPPLYNHSLTVEVSGSIRGDFEAGRTVVVRHSFRGSPEPVFSTGKPHLFQTQALRGDHIVLSLQELEDEKQARTLLEQPKVFPGWTLQDGKPVSPWGAGRAPSPLPGEAVFHVKPVPPERSIEWTNPDGDGAYTLTIHNPTGETMEVEALPSREGHPLWEEAVVLLIQEKVYRLPGSTGNIEGTVPTVIPPGESVSTVVHPILLEGPAWPRGGSRVTFGFALGDRVITESFYYMSRHHDAIRERGGR